MTKQKRKQKKKSIFNPGNDCNALREPELTEIIPYQELIKEKKLGEGASSVVYAG